MKIGVVTTTVREGRNGIKVANWVLDHAKSRNDNGVNYELVDLKNFNLPIMGLEKDSDIENITKWKNKMNEFDGFIFIISEYNHAPSGVFKNALDYLKEELHEKVISFVGYGGIGAGRAIEQIKLNVSTFSSATTGIAVNLLINTDFVNMTEFRPQEHQVPILNNLLDETIRWTKGFINIRS